MIAGADAINVDKATPAKFSPINPTSHLEYAWILIRPVTRAMGFLFLFIFALTLSAQAHSLPGAVEMADIKEYEKAKALGEFIIIYYEQCSDGTFHQITFIREY